VTPSARPAKPPPPTSRPRVHHEELALLKVVASAGADRQAVVLTSTEIGAKLGVSQQAADRYLLSLERQGLIERTLGARKPRLLLTAQGLETLRREYSEYRRIFEGPSQLKFRGTVESGLGEGRYYLSQPGYVRQFEGRLGYSPYPGTLNVRVGPVDLPRVAGARDWRGIRIDGFTASGRTFGGALCLTAHLDGVEAHLIAPDRTIHKEVAEFIAPARLRDQLHVKDGDPIDVEIQET
jgi:riboflavin kinase